MSLVYAMMGACGSAVTGGIATASRNNLRALGELARERELPLQVLGLMEEPGDRPPFLPESAAYRAFRGDKWRFSLALLRAAAARPLLCMDHVSLALPVLPLAAGGWLRTVIFCHGSESWKRMERTSRWSYQSAALCLTNSHYTLRKMQQTFSGFRGESCLLGLDPDLPLNTALPEPGGPPLHLDAADGEKRELGARFLLLVGRLHPGEREKGHRQLIGVLPRLLERFPDVQLVFPGPGDDREHWMRVAREGGVGGRVFVPGRVPRELLETLYRRCYAFVMPSRQEGFGLVYLEAMNYGRPCVGCFDDGAEDVIAHGETGLLVHDQDDPDELAGVLQQLLEDPERARRFGEKGFQRLHEHFTAAHAQQRVRERIEGLL